MTVSDAELKEQRALERHFPSVWAEKHRFMNQAPWSFKGYEFLRDIHDDMSPEIVVEKAAQLGFTEMAQNRLVHAIDFQTDSMVVFPSDDDAKRHSKARFKALLDTSPYIKSIFREVDAVDVKRSMDTALYFEGSNSGSALYSVPVGFLVVDEVDRCEQDALAAADHRLDGHKDAISLAISTPTIPDYGVSARYKLSDRKKWHVDCPVYGCDWRGPLVGEGPELETWPVITWKGYPSLPKDPEEWGPVSRTARICCPTCGHAFSEPERLEAVAKGRWIAENPESMISGYSINQLCSSTQTPAKIVYRYFKAFFDLNPAKLRQYVNQVLGKPFLGAGEAITKEMVQALTVPAVARESFGMCLGADPGKVIHAAQGERDENGKLIVRRFLELPDWDALENLIRYEGIQRAVVDRYPEPAKTEELCEAFPTVVYRAEHPEGLREMYTWDVKRQFVQIRQVDAVDVLLSRIRKRNMAIEKRGIWEEAIEHLLHINTQTTIGKNGKATRRVLHKVGGRDDMALAAIYLDAASSLISVSGAEADWTPDPSLARDAGSYGSSIDSGIPVAQFMTVRDSDPYLDDVERWENF